MADWTPTDEDMPPEGVVVEVITPSGELLRLKWHNRLWLFADGSMYLYFTPAWWRRAGPADGGPGVPVPRTTSRDDDQTVARNRT